MHADPQSISAATDTHGVAVTDRSSAETPPQAAGWRRWLSGAAFVLGAGLLAWAVVYAWKDGAAAAALSHARTAPPWQIGVLLLGPILSWVLTSILFVVLSRPWAALGVREMHALVGAAWLLNTLPVRAGLVGRVTYLKVARGLAVRDSIKISLVGAGATCFAAGVGLAAWWLSAAGTLALPMLVVAGVCGACAACGVLARDKTLTRGVLIGFALRTADMAVLAARLWVAFEIIGKPIDLRTALYLAGPAQLVGLLPIQLGTVEWAVGLLSARTAEGVTAGVVNRAADLLVSIVVGGCSLAALWRLRVQARGDFADQPRRPA